VRGKGSKTVEIVLKNAVFDAKNAFFEAVCAGWWTVWGGAGRLLADDGPRVGRHQAGADINVTYLAE
jgi:hypothetical protein